MLLVGSLRFNRLRVHLLRGSDRGSRSAVAELLTRRACQRATYRDQRARRSLLMNLADLFDADRPLP
jgi:hypothetical protein